MKFHLIHQHKFRFVGLGTLVIALICISVIYLFSPHLPINNMQDVAKLIGPYSNCIPAVYLGLVFIAFSKEKIEDEHISKIRLESLQWAIVFNYSILSYCFFFVSGTPLLLLILLNLLTPLVFFILRFRWKIWQLNKQSRMEGDAG